MLHPVDHFDIITDVLRLLIGESFRTCAVDSLLLIEDGNRGYNLLLMNRRILDARKRFA